MVLAFPVMFSLSCSAKKEAGQTLTEANQVHNEAIGIYKEAHELYAAVKKNAETALDSTLTVRLDSIHDLLHTWEDGLYEVPGFEHEHEHKEGGHDHEHKHKVAPSMTDESMLDYQKNAKAAIEEIRNTLKGMAE